MNLCSEFRHECNSRRIVKRASKRKDRIGTGIEISTSSIRIVNGGQRCPRETKRASIEWLGHCVSDPPETARTGVRTLLPPTRTSQLNVYEASGVDKAFDHKYELSAVNAPSRTEVE